MALVAAAAVQAEEPKGPLPAIVSATEMPRDKSAGPLDADEKAVRARAQKDQERQAWAVKQMRSQGYKPQTKKDGTVLWCRTETPIGSRLEQQRCSTIEAVLDTQKNGQEITNRIFDQGNRGPKSQ